MRAFWALVQLAPCPSISKLIVTFDFLVLNLSLISCIAFLNASALVPEFHAMTLSWTAAPPVAGAAAAGAVVAAAAGAAVAPAAGAVVAAAAGLVGAAAAAVGAAELAAGALVGAAAAGAGVAAGDGADCPH